MKKRQKIRKVIILISFLLFPIILYYFSPFISLQGAFIGILTGSVIVFASQFVSSLFFGRLFCGWLCPAGGLQDSCFITDKPAKVGKADWIKFFIWGSWLIMLFICIIMAGGIKEVDFFYGTRYELTIKELPAEIEGNQTLTANIFGISIAHFFVFIIYYSVIGFGVILNLITGIRAFCHYVCWMAPFMIIGNKIRKSIKYPSLHLSADKEKCISCKLCSKNCQMSLDVSKMVNQNKMEHSECILCGSCIDVCPNRVIKYSFIYKK